MLSTLDRHPASAAISGLPSLSCPAGRMRSTFCKGSTALGGQAACCGPRCMLARPNQRKSPGPRLGAQSFLHLVDRRLLWETRSALVVQSDAKYVLVKRAMLVLVAATYPALRCCQDRCRGTRRVPSAADCSRAPKLRVRLSHAAVLAAEEIVNITAWPYGHAATFSRDRTRA